MLCAVRTSYHFAENNLGGRVISTFVFSLATIAHFNHRRLYVMSHVCALIGVSHLVDKLSCAFLKLFSELH